MLLSFELEGYLRPAPVTDSGRSPLPAPVSTTSTRAVQDQGGCGRPGAGTLLCPALACPAAAGSALPAGAEPVQPGLAPPARASLSGLTGGSAGSDTQCGVGLGVAAFGLGTEGSALGTPVLRRRRWSSGHGRSARTAAAASHSAPWHGCPTAAPRHTWPVQATPEQRPVVQRTATGSRQGHYGLLTPDASWSRTPGPSPRPRSEDTLLCLSLILASGMATSVRPPPRRTASWIEATDFHHADPAPTLSMDGLSHKGDSTVFFSCLTINYSHCQVLLPVRLRWAGRPQPEFAGCRSHSLSAAPWPRVTTRLSLHSKPAAKQRAQHFSSDWMICITFLVLLLTMHVF